MGAGAAWFGLYVNSGSKTISKPVATTVTLTAGGILMEQDELNKLHKASQGPSVTNPVIVKEKKETKKVKSKRSWLKKGSKS